MGEAKNRGSRQERIDQALEQQLHTYKPTSIDEIKRQMGLSEDCSFLGYVIHLPKTDEFLAKFEDDGYSTSKIWAAIPDLALRYEDFHEAVEVLKAVSQSGRQTLLALLWEDDDRYFITVS